MFGTYGGGLVAFGALVSTFGYFSGSILSVPRLTFALGEKHQLPKVFCAVHPKYSTPYVSIVVYSTLAFLLAIFSNFITLAAISVVSRLIYYITTCGAALKFRRASRAPFTPALGAVIPVAGICFAVTLLFYTKLKAEEVYFPVGGIVTGTALYYLGRLKHDNPIKPE
jgi:amino acid transporter